MTIHVSCAKCKKELDPFDLKPHKCEPKEHFAISDDELFKVLSDELECVDEEYLKRCVQAILRKAQEK
jgi:hypothetical protein